jgi:hypothetical protein
MDYDSTPPKPRDREIRLTNEDRDLEIGKFVVRDLKSSRCVIAYHRYKGHKMVQKTHPDGMVQVWRLS